MSPRERDRRRGIPAMTQEEKRELESRLAEFTRQERNKLYRRAAKLRRAAERRSKPKERRRMRGDTRHWLDRDPDEPDPRRKTKRSGAPSLDHVVLRLLREEEIEAGAQAPEPPDADRQTGTIVSVRRGACVVRCAGGRIECVLPPELAVEQKNRIAVGDQVMVRPVAEDRMRLDTVLPRRTKLSRPDPHIEERERVIAANLDAVVFVLSVRRPPLRFRLIDRFLIAAQRGAVEPILCVNKIDQLDSREERRTLEENLEPFRRIGLTVRLVSATEGVGIEPIRELLRGKRCAFVGPSGTGKSSILNRLDPGLALRTGSVSDWSSKGTHTTTASELYELPGGIEVIDTPGIRTFGLWEVRLEELSWYFPEFGEVGGCRFGDCSHVHEPGCAIRDAVDGGRIPATRYDTYMRIRRSLA
ncbi:MAG: ribosome small subunit-dependent GTPase A [Candidatus Latescibacteria bacterium]|nr:ribosome small subunit-dependent GTPase A [Candidatus Latescibacterota bacterium]